MKHMFVLIAADQCIWSVFPIGNNYSNYEKKKWVVIMNWIKNTYALEISRYFAHGDVTIVTLYSVVASSPIVLISSLYYYNRRYNIKNVQKQKYDGHNNNNKPLYRCDNSTDRFFVKKVFAHFCAFHTTPILLIYEHS